MESAISSSTQSAVTTFESIASTNLPEIFAVFAGLVGLGLILRLIGRLVGGRA